MLAGEKEGGRAQHDTRRREEDCRRPPWGLVSRVYGRLSSTFRGTSRGQNEKGTLSRRRVCVVSQPAAAAVSAVEGGWEGEGGTSNSTDAEEGEGVALRINTNCPYSSAVYARRIVSLGVSETRNDAARLWRARARINSENNV